jgi:hypothetical protein
MHGLPELADSWALRTEFGMTAIYCSDFMPGSLGRLPEWVMGIISE